MAQSFAETPEIIYSTLTGDATFMAQVGECVFESGQTLPSIQILSPGEDIPSVKSQSGLEVIIQDIGDVNTRKYLTSDPDLLITWKVFLIVWEGSNGSTAMAAVKRLIELFPLATTIQTVANDSVLGSTFQLQARIPRDCPIMS